MTDRIGALAQRIWKQDDAAALPDLDTLSRSLPEGDQPAALRLLIFAAARAGDAPRAGEALARLCAHRLDDPELLALAELVGHETLWAQAHVALTKGETPLALALFRLGDGAWGEDPEQLQAYARALQGAGDRDGQDQLLTHLEGMPATAPISLLAGELADRLGRRKAAIRWFRRAAELQPDRPEAWRRQADLLILDGRPGQAAALLDKLADLRARFPGLALARVRALLFAGDLARARTALHEVDTAARSADWHLMRARLAQATLQPREVIAACDRMLDTAPEQAPNRAEALEMRGLARVLGGDVEGSWADALAANALMRKSGAPKLRPREGVVGGLVNEMRLDPPATERLSAALKASDPAAALAGEIREGNHQTLAGVALLGAMRRQGLLTAPWEHGEKAAQNPETEPDSGSIPPQIYIYWEQGAPPASVQDSIDAARQALPWAEVTVLDLRSALTLLRAEAPEHALRAWRLCRLPDERADFLKLALMGSIGGICLSPQIRVRGDLRALTPEGAELVLAQDRTGAPGMEFMAAAPKQALMQAILADVSREMIAGASEFTWLRTGPGALARGLAAAIAEQANSPTLPKGVHLLSPAHARSVLSETG